MPKTPRNRRTTKRSGLSLLDIVSGKTWALDPSGQYATSPMADTSRQPRPSTPEDLQTTSSSSSPSLSSSPPTTPSPKDRQTSSESTVLYKWGGFLVLGPDELGRQIQPPGGLEGRWSEFPSVNAPTSKGLNNRANDCYRSAVLQALFHVPAFYRYMGVIHEHCSAPMGECLTCCVQDLCHVSWNYDGIPVEVGSGSSRSYIQAVNQTVYEDVHRAIEANLPTDFQDLKQDILSDAQSDAREFLGYLIREQIQSKKSDDDEQSFDDMFELETQQAWTCTICGSRKSDRSETMQLGLYVPLDQEGLENGKSLQWCLQSTFADTFRVRCDSALCKATAASSQDHPDGPEREAVTTITHAPEVLFIQFGRFDNFANKISTQISYPEILDLNMHREPGFVDEECIYRLDAVVAHKGRDIDGGHYVAAVRKHHEEGFVVIDDADEIASSRGGGFQEMLRPTSHGWEGQASILMYSKL